MRETEIRELKDDKKFLTNFLAVYIDKDTTAFIDITAWGSTAEFIAEHFNKVDGFVINGTIRKKKTEIDEKEITMP